jgi:hypothetical protein
MMMIIVIIVVAVAKTTTEATTVTCKGNTATFIIRVTAVACAHRGEHPSPCRRWLPPEFTVLGGAGSVQTVQN